MLDDHIVKVPPPLPHHLIQSTHTLYHTTPHPLSHTHTPLCPPSLPHHQDPNHARLPLHQTKRSRMQTLRISPQIRPEFLGRIDQLSTHMDVFGADFLVRGYHSTVANRSAPVILPVHILSTHPIDTPSVNTSYHYMLFTSCQHSLSTHLINTSYRNPLSISSHSVNILLLCQRSHYSLLSTSSLLATPQHPSNPLLLHP